MSFLETSQRIIAEGTIHVAFLIDESGAPHWNHGEWPDLNPMDVVKAWKTQSSAVWVGELKFSVIDRDEERLVGRSIRGDGTIILAKCLNWAGYLIAWAPHEIDAKLAHAEASKMANSVQS